MIICNSIPTLWCKDCENQSSGSWDTSAPSDQVRYDTKLVAMATSLEESDQENSRKYRLDMHQKWLCRLIQKYDTNFYRELCHIYDDKNNTNLLICSSSWVIWPPKIPPPWTSRRLSATARSISLSPVAVRSMVSSAVQHVHRKQCAL